ncbi:MAG: hypothetical protein ACLPQ4_04115 [Thermoplasmata archaeon]
MVFKAEGVIHELKPNFMALQTHTTVSMTDLIQIPLDGYSPSPSQKPYMEGFAGSDLVATYFALDELSHASPNSVASSEEVEVIGDGDVFRALATTGEVTARWGGKNWGPEIVQRIRAVEQRFPRVVYRTIASPQNPAGHAAKGLRREDRTWEQKIEIRYV